ncbi:putative transcriptional regulator [Actinacidiphila reveromycinica]|uniref:Putative transcriptional regulator n=1 Tax=Actinacidiphila reveromycinica TaxID=659352 RepID=A0A7U3VS94_9ACTN|nr:AraC family transcriptional regulator [Streptomyces sp. SN-593]BBB01605.1 putative transcriptional regulator [Streptomyces sp. SN-593]
MPPAAPLADPPAPHPGPAARLHPPPCRGHAGPGGPREPGTDGGSGAGDGSGPHGAGDTDGAHDTDDGYDADDGYDEYGGTGRDSRAHPAGVTEVPPHTDAVVVPRLIATAATSSAHEAEQLARSAGLPHVLAQPETARTSSADTYRLWGAVLARTGRGDAGLLAAAGYRPGLLDVFDYLMTSAPTVGEGLARGAAHIHLISSNSVLHIEESGDEVTIGYGARRADDNLRWVVAEFAMAVLTTQLRHSTGRELSPVRVEFAHRAPRRQASHREAFGRARLEFGADADALTLHRRDLELPLDTADPALAAIMLRAAATMPPPRTPPTAAPPAPPPPVPGLREVIATQLPKGRPSLTEAARHLAISPRTLQRRLGDSGTTWRAELDAVRHEQWLRQEDSAPAQRAARLGFAESRSLRRAMSRWEADAPDDGSGGGGTRGGGAPGDTGTDHGSGGPQEAGGA